MKSKTFSKLVALFISALLLFQLVPFSWFFMADIAFASSNQSNVALGKQTTASSSLYIDNGDIHYSPEYAVDGNRSPFGETWTERWESEQVQSCDHVASNVCTSETNPPWIQVDLGGPHEINQWVVVGYMESNGFSHTVNRTKKVTIKGSLDGLHFDEIAHSNSGTIVEDESMIIHEGQFEEPVTYRFFRVEVNEMFDFVDEYYAAVAEFELYGKPVVIDNPDTTPPALANDEITPTNITQTAVTLTWEAATDNVTDTENLEYRVYQSTDSDIDTIQNIEDNGTPLGNGFTKDIESFSVTDLEPGTAYYFNVIVKDEAGNKRAYRMQKVNTESATPVMGGTAAISGTAKFGSTLTADVTGITYTPTTTQDVPSYQWKRDGDAILGAKNPTYTLVEEDIGKIITYTLTADGTHATGSVTSSGIGPVAKADGPGAPPAPVENSKTTTSISLIDSPGREYSKDGGITWQDSALFDGLTPDTDYSFVMRIKATATHEASATSPATTIRTAAQIPVTPVMGGTAAISGAAKFGSTLTADVTGITYTPTTTQDVPTYQWKRDGDAILGAKNPTYILVEEDIGKIITYTLTADGTHATGSVTSSGIGPVAKADGPGAPSAPVENSKTTTSISLIDSPGREYSKDGGITWQDSPLFDGLTPDTDYSFVMRIKATATHEASATSPATTIRTVAQLPVTPVMGGTAAISGTAKFGSILTADVTGITYTPTTTQDVPSYQWKRDGDAILGAKNPTYTLVEEDIAKIITYTLTADGTHATGSVTSSGTASVAKADGPGAPPAPTEASKTANSITLTSTPGQEYSKDGGVTWQNSPIFEGLLPNTDYHFVTRSKETATTVASPSSPSVTIRTTGTPPQPGTPAMGGTAMITGEAKYGSTLMADLTGITYSPATTLDVPTLQWLRDGVAIAGATNSAYKLTQADIGTAISYTVSADGTHATGTVTSSGTSLVVKADSPTVPAAPSEASKTATSITLHGVTGQEYSKDGGVSWQDSPLFEGLAPDTDYQFITRMKETATHHPSASSAPITIRTSLYSQSYSVSYNGNGHTGGNAPVDKNEYEDGSRVTVLGNSGNLVKARYTFAGWNTKADGSGTTYTAGSTFMLGASNVILYAKWNAISGGGGGGGSSSGSSSSPATGSSDSAVNVWVNGKAENAGTVKTAVINGQTVLTILVDQKKLDEKLAAEGQRAVVTIPMYAKNDSVVVEWNGQMISSMTDKKTILEFKTERATYTLPAEQINLDAIVAQIAEQAALQDIKVLIEIAMPSAETLEMVETASQKGSYTFVVPPITFTVKAVYNEKIINASKFNAYVERSIVIPEGVDPNKITTGVIVEPEGKVRHVPTKVVVNDGTYFAKMNSLTNSTYAIIWNPVQFDDVTSHWSKQAVNDMGSRIVVDGTGKGVFHPDRQITRAEFTAIIVRGLGLKPEQGEMIYSDVKATDWYSTTINAANSYQLISGFGDGTFRPNEKITREQAMVILAKAMTLTGTKKSDQGVEKISRDYPDLTQAAAWAQKSIEECLQAGLVSGRANESLALRENITRAEVAVLIQRLLQAADLI